MAVPFPSYVTRTAMLARPDVTAHCIQGIAIVLCGRTNIDNVLTELAFEGLLLSSAIVHHLCTVAFPLTKPFVASCTVHAGVANTFVDIDVAVASEVATGAFLDRTFARVFSQK